MNNNKNSFNLEQAKAMWETLKNSIHELQNNKINATKFRYEELYRQSYTLVLNKYGDMVYTGVYTAIADKLKITNKIVSNSAIDLLLETIVSEWNSHKDIMNLIKDILMYMDRTYCKNAKKTPVYEMGVYQFRDAIIRNPNVKPHLQQALLDNILNDRNGECIDKQVIKQALKMLVDCNIFNSTVYEEDFEGEFLKSTRDYYKFESQDFLSKNTIIDYLKKIEIRIFEEESRCDLYLDSITKKKLQTVLDQELILSYVTVMLEDPTTGARVMMESSLIEDLTRMYKLFSRQPTALEALRVAMSNLIKDLGSTLVQDTENIKDPMKFVQNVLDLREKFSKIVDSAFIDRQKQVDRQFTKTLKEAFELFVNKDSRTAQYLSAFIDDMLKKGLKGVSETEIEERLDNVMIIFRYLSDKDVFEDFYKKHLSLRLLQGRRVSDDIEKLMISKLKSECGHQYTLKMENMFKDMVLSEQIMENYLKHTEAIDMDRNKIDQLSVQVLTSGCWPIAPLQPCIIPPIISWTCEYFKSFYMKQYSGRRLGWLTSQGSAELKCSFKAGKKELIVSTYQLCILALYNNNDSFSFQDMKEMTAVPEAELKRHLLSLAHPKIKVLNKSPNTKDVQNDHIFSWNENYTNQMFRVKIPLLSMESDESNNNENPELPNSVQQSRQHSVEAAIVRIMKARHTLEHNQLVIEVTKQLSNRFTLDIAFAKKVIESLIEREYLERDVNNRRIYNYLA